MDKLALEDEVIALENAESILNVYQEFIDKECPKVAAVKNADDSKLYSMLLQYAARSERYNVLLDAAYNMLSKVRATLAHEVYGDE